MKFTAQIIVAITILLLVGCRKDPPLVGLVPEGNVLILQLDSEYTIEKSVELTLNTTATEGKLDLKINSEYFAPNYYSTIRFASSGAEVMVIRNNSVISPTLVSNSRTNSRDGRLYTKNSIADFVPFGALILNNEGLIENVGDSKLLHGYLESTDDMKISVLPYIIQVYDEDLEISVPTRKFFLFCGF